MLLAWAWCAAALAASAAAALLRALAHRGFAVHAAIAALTPVLAGAFALAGASPPLSLVDDDLPAVLVVTMAAGTTGLVTALWIGRRVAGAASTLGDVVRRIGEDDVAVALPVGAAPRGPRELVRLGGEIQLALARLATARAESLAVEARRRQLVSGVSHDLRAPLAGIRATVEALEDGVVEDPATVARYHRMLARETDRLADLVDNLFGLSRLHTGELNLHIEQVVLGALVSDVVAGASMALRAKGVDLRCEVSSPSPSVDLSVPEMTRALRNLLDNAMRHTPPGGTIRVRADLDPEREAALVAVRDACGGIPEADLPLVFEYAYRGETARAARDGGAGLGLAVARGLVDAHDGDLSVRNEGPGCCFTIRLPLARRPYRQGYRSPP